MEFKILESNGVENENVDGAALNNAMAGGKDGILKGVLNECSVYSPTSNSVAVGAGVIMIQGFRVKITDPWNKSFLSTPSSNTEYQIVAKITLLSTREVYFEMICRVKQDLQKESIFNTESGVYETEIATFIHSVSGNVTNLVQTIDYFSGGGSSLPPAETERF